MEEPYSTLHPKQVSLTSHSQYTASIIQVAANLPITISISISISTSSPCLHHENAKEAHFLDDGAMSFILRRKIQVYFRSHQVRIHAAGNILVHSCGIITCEFVFLASLSQEKIVYYDARLQANVPVSVYAGGVELQR